MDVYRVTRTSPRRVIIMSHMRGHFHSLEVMRTCFLTLLSLATSTAAFRRCPCKES
jgi:hypothetical protein